MRMSIERERKELNKKFRDPRQEIWEIKISLARMCQWEDICDLWQRNHGRFRARQAVFVLLCWFISKSQISNRELRIDFLGDHPHRGSGVFWTSPPVHPTDTSHSTFRRLNCTVIHKQFNGSFSSRLILLPSAQTTKLKIIASTVISYSPLLPQPTSTQTMDCKRKICCVSVPIFVGNASLICSLGYHNSFITDFLSIYVHFYTCERMNSMSSWNEKAYPTLSLRISVHTQHNPPPSLLVFHDTRPISAVGNLSFLPHYFGISFST